MKKYDTEEPQTKEKNGGTVEINTLEEIDNHSPKKARQRSSSVWLTPGSRIDTNTNRLRVAERKPQKMCCTNNS